MERISSMSFCLSLVFYYILKLLKVKRSIYLRSHIILGSISVLAMIIELIQRVGQDGLIKYIGFAVILCAIGISGVVMKRKYRLYKKLHILFTILFFIYLSIAIKFM